MIPVRWCVGQNRVTRVFEDGVVAGHPLDGEPCRACDEPIQPGQPLALVYVGPGDGPDDQEKYRDGRWHTGAAVALHQRCAGDASHG